MSILTGGCQSCVSRRSKQIKLKTYHLDIRFFETITRCHELEYRVSQRQAIIFLNQFSPVSPRRESLKLISKPSPATSCRLSRKLQIYRKINRCLNSRTIKSIYKLWLHTLSVQRHNMIVRSFNPLTAVSRGSGYKLFVTRYRQPAFRIEHYMQKRAVSRCYG